jgi:hypothetical protein
VIIVPGLRHGRGARAGRGGRPRPALREKGVEVRFAIHPVAGRLPGHMNVLLAEAACRTTSCTRWTRSTRTSPAPTWCWSSAPTTSSTPARSTTKSSPIYGMPVLEVWKSRLVVVLKRGMARGLRRRREPALLYRREKSTRMLFGDAKKHAPSLRVVWSSCARRVRGAAASSDHTNDSDAARQRAPRGARADRRGGGPQRAVTSRRSGAHRRACAGAARGRARSTRGHDSAR